MDYYRKYIKYKIKYNKLKATQNIIINEKDRNQLIDITINTHIDKVNNQTNNNVRIRIDDNINNKYPILEKEVNAFGYLHTKIYGGCLF